jgi:single-stranded-DNA-specific exonuclease
MEAKRPGVAALREVATVTSPVGATDIAFRLAPRLNAAGRLGDPAITLALLRAKTLPEARELAARIEAINDERKAIERQVTQEAIDQVLEVYGERPATGIVVAGVGWHRGVVGITAARLVDRFHRPTVVIGIDGAHGHGSARTPDGFPLYDAVARCAADLDRFGGHQAAAGMTLASSRIEAFRAGFADASLALASGGLTAAPTPLADCALDGATFPIPTPRDLWRIEPLGERNVEPLFVIEGARLEHISAVGQGEAHLKLRVRIGRELVPAFGFDIGHLAAELPDRVDLLGYVRFDHWRGGRTVEIRVRDLFYGEDRVAHGVLDRPVARESLPGAGPMG